MKVCIRVAAVFFSVLLPVLSFSQEPGATGGGNKLIERRIIQTKFFTLDEILDTQQESKQIFLEDRVALYNRYQKNTGMAIGALALNLLVPGTGNLLLGDIGGGVTLLSVSLTGAALFFVPFLANSLFAKNLHDSNYASFVILVNIMPALGATVFLSAYVIGMILPFTYSNLYNSNLKMGLGIASAGHGPEKDLFASAVDYRDGQTMNLRLLEFRF